MSELDKMIKQGLRRRPLLPGVETGRYENQTDVDRDALGAELHEQSERRDNRINVRVSGKDLTELQKQATAEGIPTQSLIAQIIHQYVQGVLVDISRSTTKAKPDSASADKSKE